MGRVAQTSHKNGGVGAAKRTKASSSTETVKSSKKVPASKTSGKVSKSRTASETVVKPTRGRPPKASVSEGKPKPKASSSGRAPSKTKTTTTTAKGPAKAASKETKKNGRRRDEEEEKEPAAKKHQYKRKPLGDVNKLVNYKKQAQSVSAFLQKPNCSGIEVPTRIFKNGLDREASLSRAGILRADKTLMDALSHAADRTCKAISRQLYSIMLTKMVRSTPSGCPRILGKDVDEALANMGVDCLFAQPF